jgi:uncharacterized membrane protein
VVVVVVVVVMVVVVVARMYWSMGMHVVRTDSRSAQVRRTPFMENDTSEEMVRRLD